MTPGERQRLVAQLEMTEAWLDDEVKSLSPAQLKFKMTPESWSVEEVVMHLAIAEPQCWDQFKQSLAKPAPDGRALYVTRLGELPATIHVVKIADGTKRLWRTFLPVDAAGVGTARRAPHSRAGYRNRQPIDAAQNVPTRLSLALKISTTDLPANSSPFGASCSVARTRCEPAKAPFASYR